MSEQVVEVKARSSGPSRTDWINIAISALVDEGIAGVKIQRMAKRLSVARSSFYWHFKNPEQLHSEMLSHWLKRNTGPIIERAMRLSPDINEAVLSVFECWVDPGAFDPELDMAIRLWARTSPKVEPIVRQADAQRLDALAQMFERYGSDKKIATVRARVLYFTQIGQFTLFELEEPSDRFSHVENYLKIFTGIDPTNEQLDRFIRFAEKALGFTMRNRPMKAG